MISKTSVVTFSGLLAFGVSVFFTVGNPKYRIVDITPMQWYICLSSATAILFLQAIFAQCKSADVKFYAVLVCFCYWHRATFMHCTVERDCFWDIPLLSCSFWGRTVACVGELAFVHVSTKQIAPRFNKLILFLIAVAETISFIGVIKKHYLWFFFENSIWTLCTILLIYDLFMYNKNKSYESVPLLLCLFVLYNCCEDLPMYLKRHYDKTHLPGYNVPFVEGLVDSFTCDYVGHDSKVWDPQMLWQTLNYIIVPAASIGLMSCCDDDDDAQKKK
jgi:hypothetical protein